MRVQPMRRLPWHVWPSNPPFMIASAPKTTLTDSVPTSNRTMAEESEGKGRLGNRPRLTSKCLWVAPMKGLDEVDAVPVDRVFLIGG